MAFRSHIYSAALAAVLGLCAPVLAGDDDFAAPDRSVTLDAPSTAKLGIATVTAQAKPYQVETHGLGQVLGLDVLGQTDSELAVAESAARASQAALTRAQAMFAADTGISRQALETAEHQATTDNAQLALAQRKAVSTWGRDTPWHSPEERRALMAKIGAGKVLIVRATFPARILDAGPPPTVRIETLGAQSGARKDAKVITATTIWAAPADPTAPGHTCYMLVDATPELGDGDRVRVIAVSATGKQGAYIPAASVLIAEGGTWVYIEEKPDYFVRQAVDLSQPSGAGYVVPYGVQPGEKVVTTGAAHLLARETGTEE
jgi:hypothetical protein